jgi:hypothetical protein
MSALLNFLKQQNYNGRLTLTKDNHLLHVEIGHRYLIWDTKREYPISIDLPYDGMGG